MVGDPGNERYDGTRFYYNPGKLATESGDGEFINSRVNSMGPALEAVAQGINAFNPDEVLGLGDLIYNSAPSTYYDEAIGQFYNQFIAPYPSTIYTDSSNNYRAEEGLKVWPFDTFDYPNGYPNPNDSSKRGGSEDGNNHYWPTPGNHEYGGRFGSIKTKNDEITQYKYTDTNVSTGLPDSTIETPEGVSSTAVPQPYVDYFPWLTDKSILQQSQRSSVSIGRADGTGNSGIYYKASLGDDGNGRALVDIFSIDAQRLIVNAGGKYPVKYNGFGAEIENEGDEDSTAWNLEYNPSIKPDQSNEAVTTAVLSDDPHNGYKQFKWFKKKIKKSDAHWKIVIGHQPAYMSGEYDDGMPGDNLSNPTIQAFLKGLMDSGAKFHAYANGHTHSYQRVLENSPSGQGIGAGIPFMTLGNGGRIAESVNDAFYGENIYRPENFQNNVQKYWGVANKKLKDSPYSSTGVRPYLLDSNPITAGISGLQYNDDGQSTTGLYGWGFGWVDTTANEDYLFFQYKQTEVVDPAISENLNKSTRNQALSGWKQLSASDWEPRKQNGDDSASLDDTAILELTLSPSNGGSISAVSIARDRDGNRRSGSGYMQSKGGNQKVDFEIRGNDFYDSDTSNPNKFAIINLKFKNGNLKKTKIKESGQGYENLGQLTQAYTEGLMQGSTIEFTDDQKIYIPINHSLQDSWYEIPYTDYEDSYLITHTIPVSDFDPDNGTLTIKMKPASKDAKDIIRDSNLTTAYSGEGNERYYKKAQTGLIRILDINNPSNAIASGTLIDGVATISINTDSYTEAEALVDFSGDPFSSLLVNFLPSQTSISLV